MRSILFIAVLVACASCSRTLPSAAACHDGWSAKQKIWVGRGTETITFVCRNGTPLMIIDDEPGLRGVPESTKRVMDRETWDELWRRLDRAAWHTVDARPTSAPDVEVEISNGKVTKKFAWGQPHSFTQQELDINAALNVAYITAETPVPEEI